MSERTALLLLDFDLPRNEKMSKSITASAEINKMYAQMTKNGATGGVVRLTNLTPFNKLIWDIGAEEGISDISNVSAVFDTLNLYKCDTIFCDVCEEHSERYALYSYIRELARLCGINVVPMTDVRRYIQSEGETT